MVVIVPWFVRILRIPRRAPGGAPGVNKDWRFCFGRDGRWMGRGSLDWWEADRSYWFLNRAYPSISAACPRRDVGS